MKEEFIYVLIAMFTCLTIFSFAQGKEQSLQPANKGRNHLADTTSPYLLQHQHSPVHWHPWCEEAFKAAEENPILIDKFIDHAMEVDVDAISDGKQVHIAGIMQHIEEAGIHSGDSACSLPCLLYTSDAADE